MPHSLFKYYYQQIYSWHGLRYVLDKNARTKHAVIGFKLEFTTFAAYEPNMRNLMTIPTFRSLKSKVLHVTLQYRKNITLGRPNFTDD